MIMGLPKLCSLALLLSACGYIPDYGQIYQAANEWRDLD